MKKLSPFFIICLLLIAIAVLWLRGDFSVSYCGEKPHEEVVRGYSLSGLIENGQTVQVINGYGQCGPLERNDLVVYRYGGYPYPLLKIVKGVPGDSLVLGLAEGGNKIFINGKAVVNAQNEVYLLDAQESQMLSLYIRDYHEKIPEQAYLILGNIPSGSLDSTRFGLVGEADIIGKVVKW